MGPEGHTDPAAHGPRPHCHSAAHGDPARDPNPHAHCQAFARPFCGTDVRADVEGVDVRAGHPAELPATGTVHDLF